MRQLTTRVAIAALALCLLPGRIAARDGRADRGHTDHVIEVTLNLSDGSRVIGTPDFDEFEIDTGYGSLVIPAKDLSEVSFLDTDSWGIKVRLRNSDVIHGKSKSRVFPVATKYGRVKIDHALVNSMLVRTYAGNVDAGLVAYYPLDDDANDSSGRHHKGNIFRATPTEGRVGGAFRFNGRDAIRLSDPVVHGPPLTVSLWFRSDAKPHENGYLLSNGGQTGASQGFALLIAGTSHVEGYGYPSDGIGFFVGDQSSNFRALMLHPVSTSEWHHIVATWDGTPNIDNISMYIDGKEVKALPWTSSGGSSFGPVQNLVIGMPSNVLKYGYIGDLDEIRIYDRVLSLPQVQLLYRSYQQ